MLAHSLCSKSMADDPLVVSFLWPSMALSQHFWILYDLFLTLFITIMCDIIFLHWLVKLHFGISHVRMNLLLYCCVSLAKVLYCTYNHRYTLYIYIWMILHCDIINTIIIVSKISFWSTTLHFYCSISIPCFIDAMYSLTFDCSCLLD